MNQTGNKYCIYSDPYSRESGRKHFRAPNPCFKLKISSDLFRHAYVNPIRVPQADAPSDSRPLSSCTVARKDIPIPLSLTHTHTL